MNIADKVLSHYESDDFKENYAYYLMEDTHNCIDRIQSIARSYEFEKMYGKTINLTFEQAESVMLYIDDNYDTFLKDMVYGWTGGTSIDSVSFGEQEEQLTGIYNNKTKKDYNLPYLHKVFNQAGFYVKGEYAYYDLSYSGLYIDLLAAEIPVLKELLNS